MLLAPPPPPPSGDRISNSVLPSSSPCIRSALSYTLRRLAPSKSFAVPMLMVLPGRPGGGRIGSPMSPVNLVVAGGGAGAVEGASAKGSGLTGGTDGREEEEDVVLVLVVAALDVGVDERKR